MHVCTLYHNDVMQIKQVIVSGVEENSIKCVRPRNDYRQSLIAPITTLDKHAKTMNNDGR